MARERGSAPKARGIVNSRSLLCRSIGRLAMIFGDSHDGDVGNERHAEQDPRVSERPSGYYIDDVFWPQMPGPDHVSDDQVYEIVGSFTDFAEGDRNA